MSLQANDLEKFWVAENYTKVNINNLMREVKKALKESLIHTHINTSLGDISLTSSETNYGGKRYWFVCPDCSGRVGDIYKSMDGLCCRKCLGVVYYQQRYK